jgi:hypothetical protein
MKKEIAGLKNSFATFIQCGQLILNCTEEKIRENFPENQITVLSNFNSDKSMEIRFEDSTLTCLFNDNSTCSLGFLFFDDLESLDAYREVCNNLCEKIAPAIWKYDNYCIELRSDKTDFHFVFCLRNNP